MHEAWRTAAAGRPTLVLVTGGAGVGKTRLVAEIADTARAQPAVVASTQCFGTSGRLALAPVADWLRTPRGPAHARRARPALARRGRQARTVRHHPPGTRRRPPGDGRRLAAPPVLRRPGAGPDRRRPPGPADPRQHPVVRPGDADVPDVLPVPDPRRAPDGGRDSPHRRHRREPGPRAMGRPDADRRSAHRAATAAPGGLRHRPPGRGARRVPARPAGRRTAARDHRRLPALHHRSDAQRTGPRPRRQPGRRAARPDRAGEPRRTGRRPTRRGGRPQLHPRPAHRGQRPRRRRRGARRRRAVATQNPATVPRRLRLLPRPAPRRRLRPDQPAPALAAAPPSRAEPRIAARRRQRQRLGATRRAVRPRGTTGPGSGLLPSRGRCRLEHLRPHRGDPTAQEGARHRPHPIRGAQRGRTGTRRPRSDGGAAQRQIRLLLPRTATDPRALDPAGRIPRPQGLPPGRPRRALVVAVRAGKHCRRPRGGDPRPDPRRPRLPAERIGPLRIRRFGGRARPPRGGAPPLRPRGRTDPGRSLVDRRHPARRARQRLGGTRPLAARPQRRRTDLLQRGRPAGPDDRSSVQPGRRPGLQRHHPPPAGRPRRPRRRRRGTDRPVRPVRIRLLQRVGADSRRLVPRRRGRPHAGAARHRHTPSGRFVRPDAVLALAARRPVGAGRRSRRRPRRARCRPRRRTGPRRPVVAARGDADARGARRPRRRDRAAARRRPDRGRPRQCRPAPALRAGPRRTRRSPAAPGRSPGPVTGCAHSNAARTPPS
ncbi:AAA family ATPase [Rhodococcus sp. M8-20]|uniref:AAA family ATPase n=1 Tax=Rhodococcus sp. M8-20 TaxID=3058375 RepID=UPI00324B3DC6